MVCNGCGNLSAHRISYSSHGEKCDKCGNLNGFKFSDVFFKGAYFDPNLSDPVKSPQGQEVKSREHKADILRQLGLREVGDKRHGSRAQY